MTCGTGSEDPKPRYQMGVDLGRGGDSTGLSFWNYGRLAGLFISDPQGTSVICGVQGRWLLPYRLTAVQNGPAGDVGL